MDMGGMSMGGTTGGFRITNERLSHTYWYGIAGAVGLLTLVRVVRILESKQRRASQQNNDRLITSRPNGTIAQAYATATATVREITYPQPVYFTGRISKYFSPLPVGRWTILALYWVVLLCFLWTDTILGPNDSKYAYRWEKVGFRAAWVSIAQIPFIYLLSCKFNPISLLTGISYERFNWLHRWAARTVFLTVIVHWSYFYRQWDLANFVKYQMEMMPMVKYGFGAWAVITWMVLTGFGFIRAQRYEIFVAQHICAAATLLWLLWVHVPTYASYYIWMAVGFVAFDWIARIVWALLRNTHALGGLRMKKPGYSVQIECLPGDMVRLLIKDVDFAWKAGQHAYISIPRLRPLELHPFTIANAATDDGRLEMVIKAHSGFSNTLRKAAEKHQIEAQSYRAFLSGPWGHPPGLLHYDTVVFIACSSGASFVIPLLQDLVRKQSCARNIVLHWIVREEEHVSWYEPALRQALAQSQSCRFRLQVVVHVTRFPLGGQEPAIRHDPVEDEKAEITVDISSTNGSSSANTSSTSSKEIQVSPTSSWHRLSGRPTVESIIRPPVETALGETAVVVCGGLSVTAESRTFVAALSDERAVHKGTGAQGIFLFTETYGW